MIHACVLYMNLRKRLRLLLRLFFSWTPTSIQNRLEEPIYAYFLNLYARYQHQEPASCVFLLDNRCIF